MRDRALAMKWVESVAAECCGDSAKVLEKLTERGVSQNTIADQMRRLCKQGLLPSKEVESSDVGVAVKKNSARSKPFSPVPKSQSVKKKS